MTKHNDNHAAQRIINIIANHPALASEVKEVSYADGVDEPVGPRGLLELTNGACVVAVSDADNHDDVLVSMAPFRGTGANDVAYDVRHDICAGDEEYFAKYVAAQFVELAARVDEGAVA